MYFFDERKKLHDFAKWKTGIIIQGIIPVLQFFILNFNLQKLRSLYALSQIE